MVNKKDLRGGIEKMREVAQLLTGWADDLEGSLEAGKKKKTTTVDKAPVADAPVAARAEADTDAPSEAPVETEVAVPVEPVAEAQADASAETPVLLSPDSVRAVLAAKCAAGFRAQVQALINSFGAAKFSEVAQEHYPALLDAVSALGGDGDPDAS